MQDGSRVPFKVKFTTVFDKLFKAYCARKSLDVNNMVFITPNGDRINGSQTPADVRLIHSVSNLPMQGCCCSVFDLSMQAECSCKVLAAHSLTWRTATRSRRRHIRLGDGHERSSRGTGRDAWTIWCSKPGLQHGHLN